MKSIQRLSIALIMLLFGSLSLYSQGPELISPINQETCMDTTLVLFMWNVYPQAVDYRIEVSTTANFSNIIIDEATSNGTTYVSTSLNAGTTYYWRVYAVFDPHDPEEVSETWSFLTTKNPPSHIQPIDNNTCVTKTYEFQWQTITNATYNFQLSRTSDFSSLIEDRTGLTEARVTVTMPEYYQRYYWRVQAEYDGCITYFSAADSFLTQRQPATLESPDDNINSVSKNGLRFTWSAAVAPTNYIFQVSLDSTFSSVGYEYIGTSTTDSIDNLLNNSVYYWRVRLDYNDCYSPWTEVRRFRTEYEKPDFLYPRDDSSCVPLTLRFQWGEVYDAVTYHVQISELMDFSTLVLDSTGINIYYMNYTMPKSEQSYYWRVKAEDANNSGPWSDANLFTTAVTYPQRITPVDGADNLTQTILFKWTKSNMYSYETIQVSDDSTFRQIIFEQKNIGGDSIILKMPDQFVTYYWRLKSEVNLCVSNWSQPWSFRTVLLPPDLTYPADDAEKLGSTLTFQWNGAEGAKTYDFKLSKDPNFTYLVVGRTGIKGEKLYYKGLEPSTEYFWMVRSINSKGESVWSKVFSFTTAAEALDPPNLISPRNGQDKLPVNKVYLFWNTVDRATKYTLEVADNKDFMRPIISQPDMVDTSFTLTAMNYGTTYYWRAMAANDSLESAWSEVRTFSTVIQLPTDAPVLIQPVDKLDPAPTEMTFKWQAVDRAENYDFEIAYDEQFTNFFLQDTNVFNPKRFVSNIDFENTLFWRVRAKNYSGKGPWSQTRSFTTLVNSINDELAEKFNTSINPNPMSNVSTLSMTLPNSAFVNVDIYSATGSKVRTLSSQLLSSGLHLFTIDSKELSNGAYFVSISVDDRTYTMKFVVNK